MKLPFERAGLRVTCEDIAKGIWSSLSTGTNRNTAQHFAELSPSNTDNCHERHLVEICPDLNIVTHSSYDAIILRVCETEIVENTRG